MPTKRLSRTHPEASDSTAAVDALMAKLEHPMKAEIQALRELVLGVDPSIAEGVKWNAPSFRTSEYFATVHLRSKVGVGLILHRGAKARDLPAGGMRIDDPGRLLEWLDDDRARFEFASGAELAAKRASLRELLRQWIRHV